MNAVIYIQCPLSLIDTFTCDFSVESVKNTNLIANSGIDPSSIAFPTYDHRVTLKLLVAIRILCHILADTRSLLKIH